MLFDDTSGCPYNNFKSCRETRKKKDGCALYMFFGFRTPDTGRNVQEWGCAHFWAPYMSMAAAQEAKANVAAIESFRNAVVKRADEMAEDVPLDVVHQLEG